MSKVPVQRTEYTYPPARELWSVLGTALSGAVFWLLGIAVRNLSIRMLDDPVVGCASLGCAPGLVNFASLFLFLIAILLCGFAFLGFMSFIRRPVAMAMMILGGLGTLVAIAGLFIHYDYSIVRVGLIVGPVFLLSGLLAYKSAVQA